jgi:hypothetical protein
MRSPQLYPLANVAKGNKELDDIESTAKLREMNVAFSTVEGTNPMRRGVHSELSDKRSACTRTSWVR